MFSLSTNKGEERGLKGIMKTLKALLTVLLAGILLMSNIVAAQAVPQLPSSIYGTVKVDGANVPVGAPISAWIEGVQYAVDLAKLNKGGNTVYSLTVPADDPTTEKIEGGTAGDEIIFHIGDLVAVQTGTWAGGNQVNINLTGTTAATPEISITGSLSAFSSVAGAPSPAQSYTVSGSGLTAGITITPPADFQVSLNSSSGFGSSLVLNPTSGAVASTTIYVRFSRAAAGSSSGNITHTSTGASSKNLAVSGMAADIIVENTKIFIPFTIKTP